MRLSFRIALLGAASAFVLAPAAHAANSMSVKVSPNKRGTLTLGAPTSFAVDFTSPDRSSTLDGNQRLKAIIAKLPDQLVFNPIPFTACKITSFIATKECPSSTRLGSVTITADGGPEIGVIPATATLFFGSGYSVLARVQANKPAVIDEAVVGTLQSSGTSTDASTGYGLQMFIPVTPIIQQPLTGVFPSVKSFKATVTPMTKKVRVPGVKGRYTLPIVGLGPCSKLNFQVAVSYTNAALVDTIATDSASGTASCTR